MEHLGLTFSGKNIAPRSPEMDSRVIRTLKGNEKRDINTSNPFRISFKSMDSE